MELLRLRSARAHGQTGSVVTPVRALFVNEGMLGPGMLGHASLAKSMEHAFKQQDDLVARFVSLAPLEGVALRAANGLPVLGRLDLDLQTVRWHAVQAARARRVVQRELVREPVDVLHVHSHTIALGLLDIMARIPTLVSVDVTVWDWRAQAIYLQLFAHSRAAVRPSLAAERRVFQRSTAVLAWSQWAQRGVSASCPDARVVLQHPGVDVQRFRPAAPGPVAGPQRVIFVGGRFAAKGGEDLLWALDPLLRQGRVELDLVTTAEVGARPGVHIHRLGPGDERLPALLQRADIFCLPTLGDTSPHSILEAMACGTVVVASEIGGIPEMLDGGRAGVLVQPGDRFALREALSALLVDHERRRTLSVAARARAEERYDADRQSRDLFELLAATGAARRSAPP